MPNKECSETKHLHDVGADDNVTLPAILKEVLLSTTT